MRRTAQKCLQVFDVHLLAELGVFDGLKGVGAGLVTLLLLGALLFYLFSVLAASLFLLQPCGVVLDPDVLLQLTLLLIENELLHLFGIYLISLFLNDFSVRFLAFALFEDSVSDVAQSF